MASVANSFFLQEVFKDAEKIQSFVIEELAMRQLLESAWRPVGRKLLKHLNGVVDFRKNTFYLPKSLNLAMWLTEDMYDATLEKVWEKIVPTVKKYVSKAYQRGIDEEGNPPLHTAKKTVTKSVSSVYAERKAQAIDILVNMARMSFTGYARESAIPAIKQAINGLGRLETLRKNLPDTQLDIDRQVAEIGRMEMLRKLRVAALDNARIKLINSLRKQVGEYPLAGTMANLTVSRAHHFGFLDWADVNGIMYYEVSAVLDDKTCPACFKMDGKVFSVKDALAYRDKFLAAAGDKNRLKADTPFLTNKTVDDVQGINQSNIRGITGNNERTSSAETRAGTGHFYFPPFHPSCRCTVVAIRDFKAYERQEIDGQSASNEGILPALPESSRDIGAYGVDDDGSLLSISKPALSAVDFTGFESLPAAMEYYTSILPALKFELSAVESKVALEALNQFERLRLEYPELSSRLELIAFAVGIAGEGTQNALGWTQDDGSKLVLNSRYFRDYEGLKKRVKANIEEGVFVAVAAASVEQIVTHEVGHLLYAALSGEQKALLEELFAKGVASDLSLVAQQDASEMFAEAFTAVHHGVRVSEEIAAIMKILGKRLKLPVRTIRR